MKLLLVCLNIFLAGVLSYSVAGLARGSSTRTPVKAVTGTKRTAAKSAPAAEPETTAKAETGAAERVIAADIFNTSRLPDAASMNGGRLEIVLVGTFEIGDVKGAVIRQRTITRQVNPFMQMMRPGGGMGGMGGPGGMGGQGGFGGIPGGRSSLFRQRFGAGNFMQNNQIGNPKLYVRLGETISNGYTLAEVSRSRAVFVRGNDRLELDLVPPSRSAASASGSRGQRLNVNQQLQQAQIMTQQMMIRMMQQMQQQNNQQRGGNRGGNQGGARRPGR